MNPIPFKYLDTYEVTSLAQLLSMTSIVDEATQELEQSLYEDDMREMAHTSYQPCTAWCNWFQESDEDTDIPFWFLEEPMEGGHEYDSEVIPF